MHHTLTKHEEWLIITLSRRLRVLKAEQIATGWFDGDLRTTRRSISALEEEDLLAEYSDLVTEPLPIKAPLVTWEPYQGKAPHFSELAYEARKRWDGKPKRTRLYHATTTAINRYAGYTSGTPTPANALNHDLQVSELYLHFLATEPQRTRRFIGEDEWKELGHCGHKTAVPDAVIRHRRDYRKNIMIELAGQYGPERLEHWHNQYQGFRYEVW